MRDAGVKESSLAVNGGRGGSISERPHWHEAVHTRDEGCGCKGVITRCKRGTRRIDQ
jgi:hypothetical protein